ncbi:MAG: GNAT family N-acetyltransferase [Vampirovibrionales bacterium]|nr:GNAT family N-acetyltransferase [Vampirovibrionales bacterium]
MLDISFKCLPPACSPEHLATLQQIAVDTFTETFGQNYPADDLADYLSNRLSASVLAQELRDPTARFALVFVDDAPVGYLKWLLPCERYLTAQNRPRHWHARHNLALLERFYFLSQAQGTGAAQIAWAWLIAGLKASKINTANKPNNAAPALKADAVYLSVWEHNYKAQRFYQNLGFRTFGSMAYPVGNTHDVELLMSLEL